MWYLFKNVWKAIWSNKVHFFSLLLLVVASLSVSWGVLSANSGLSHSYIEFVKKSNPDQFVIDLNSSVEFFKSPASNIENVKKFIQKFKQNLKNLDNANLKLEMTYRDERIFSYKKDLLLAIGYPPGYDDDQFFGFDNNKVDSIITNNVAPSSLNSGEIMVESNYAQSSNWSIGDKVYNIFAEKAEYKIVGNALSYDFSYPLLSPINVVASTSSNGLIYISPNDLYSEDPSKARLSVISSADRTQLLLLRFQNPKSYTLENLNKIQIILQNTYQQLKFSLPNDIHSGIRSKYYGNQFFPERTDSFFQFIRFEKLASYFLSSLIIIVSCFVIVTVTRKRVEQDTDSILIFKALGFSKYSITLPYSIYPTIFSLLCFLISLLISYGFQYLIYSIFSSMFTIPLIKISFSYIAFILNICLITFIFIIVAFLSTWWTLRKLAKGR